MNPENIIVCDDDDEEDETNDVLESLPDSTILKGKSADIVARNSSPRSASSNTPLRSSAPENSDSQSNKSALLRVGSDTAASSGRVSPVPSLGNLSERLTPRSTLSTTSGASGLASPLGISEASSIDFGDEQEDGKQQEDPAASSEDAQQWCVELVTPRGKLYLPLLKTPRTLQREENWWMAVNNGDLDDCRRMLRTGQADVHDTDIKGKPDSGTALHLAAQNGRQSITSLLLQHDALVNARAYSETPLHLAATNGHVIVCEQLLDAGASINAKTGAMWTPLHFAAMNGHFEVVELLLKRGASTKCTISFYYLDNKTPLMMAAERGREDCVKALLDYGADRHFRTRRGYSAFWLARKYPNTLRLLHEYAVDKQPRCTPIGTPIYHALSGRSLVPVKKTPFPARINLKEVAARRRAPKPVDEEDKKRRELAEQAYARMKK